MGRPSSFTQDIADRICEHLIEGKSLRSICLADDMPSAAAVCRWLGENEPFREQYAQARDAQADTLADEIVDIADGEKGSRPAQDSNRDRLRVDARKWVAAKLKPKKYGDKLDVTSGNEPVKLDETAVAARIASLIRTGLDRDG